MGWDGTGQHFHGMGWDGTRLSWDGTGQDIPRDQLSWDGTRYLFMEQNETRSLWNERSRSMSRNETGQDETRALWDKRFCSSPVASLIMFQF